MIRFALLIGFSTLSLPAQDLWVSLSNENKISACAPTQNTCSDLVANGVGGLTKPQAMTLGPDDRLYVTSLDGHQVLRFEPDGRFVDVFVAPDSGGLTQPTGLVFGPDGHLYVASSGSHEILRYNGGSGGFMDAFVNAGSGGLESPSSLVFGKDDYLYVLSETKANVLRYHGGGGQFIDEFLPSGSGGLERPRWLGFGPDDFLYITDFNRHQVLRFDPNDGTFWDIFTDQNLARPAGACFDPDGNLAVASFSNNQINVYGPDGSLTQSFDAAGGPNHVLCPVSQKPSIAATLLYPWISNNEGFESIVVAHNYAPVPAIFRLSARRAQGPAENVERTVPAGGFLRESAADLFPILGNGSGFSVLLESTISEVSGVWVTNNLTTASGSSPSQGVAVELPKDEGQASVRLGHRIAYGFLPTTNGLISAPVVVNLGPEKADVTLQFFDASGTLVLEDRNTLAGLTPLRPFAAVANSLIPAGTGDVFVIASSESQRITGVSFVFNSGAEPAIGNVTAVDDRFAPEDQKVQWLKDHAIPITSVSPEEEDFSDLQPLVQELEGVRVLMLGEQTHGDGTTFSAKIRLVKFLHQQMGFDVLAFESGLYDCRKAWQAYLTESDPEQAFGQGVFGIWSGSEQVNPLIHYLADTLESGNPLELAGFDSQFSGSVASEAFADDLESFLNGLGAQATNNDGWTKFKEEVQGITENRFVNNGAPPQEDQTAFFSLLEDIQNELDDLVAAPPTSEQHFWIQMLNSFEIHVSRSWQYDFANPNRNRRSVLNMRDEQMGRNLVWLADQYYQGRKIIVWAATLHIARNIADQLRNVVSGDQVLHPKQVTMGDLVRDSLGDQAYAMGFTAYEGTWGTAFGNPVELVQPGAKDLETLFKESGMTNAFVNLRTSAPASQWLRQSLISRPLGYVRVGADWSQVLDGMIYTRTMTPSTAIQGKRFQPFFPTMEGIGFK